MPQTAIFIATPADKNKWSNVLNNLHPQARSPSAAIERLSETVWQLRLAASPAALGHLISACEQFGIAYRILILDGEPQWLLGDPSQTPTPAARSGQP